MHYFRIVFILIFCTFILNNLHAQKVRNVHAKNTSSSQMKIIGLWEIHPGKSYPPTPTVGFPAESPPTIQFLPNDSVVLNTINSEHGVWKYIPEKNVISMRFPDRKIKWTLKIVNSDRILFKNLASVSNNKQISNTTDGLLARSK